MERFCGIEVERLREITRRWYGFLQDPYKRDFGKPEQCAEEGCNNKNVW